MRPTFGREYIENEFQRIGDDVLGPERREAWLRASEDEERKRS